MYINVFGCFVPGDQDEEYQVSKRHLSEKFFNMQISPPRPRGLSNGHPAAQGVAEGGGGGDEFGKFFSFLAQ